ncbi:cell surface A33 antigen-like isoform X2 [Centropristis striata]|uniref:cell surface A33 antigen-like isoform X2 n=1 Tax=Centropristis striata TaxID=184440 RepID=UPI0027DFBBA8|nr:cell surface A33 antigen-like isoform X2 [Centropristis striata]
MLANRQFGWRKLFLILSVLPCCRSMKVSIPEKEYEIARGEDITLTCSFAPARAIGNALVVTWEVYPEKEGDPTKSVGTYFINNPIDIAPAYEGRATMEVDVARLVSTLTIKQVTIQDSRIYQCSVIVPNDDEGNTAASTFVLVLVPPSPPNCGIEGEATYFQDISLTCASVEGSPTPGYTWRTYTVQNMPREFPPKTTEANGVLKLFNITRETSGFFICTSTNRIGSASCNLTLAVTPGSMNIGSTAGIIVGVLAGVVLLGIIIFCCCCRKKDKKDEYAEGAPGEAEFYDKDAPEVDVSYRDDESRGEITKVNQREDKAAIPLNNYREESAAPKFEEDQHSYNSKDRYEGKGSEVGSQRYQDDQRDHRRGSHDRLEDERDRYRGSRDRLDDQRDRYTGSRDRLDDKRNYHSGSRDRLDDQRDRYGGSRDRLDDERDRYRGSRDRLDDQRDRYGGSRDRLDDRRGSRDRLDYADDESRNRY